MKIDSKKLLLLLLLLVQLPESGAQDDMSEDELNSLLNETESVQPPIEESASETVVSPPQASEPELSSETVDLEFGDGSVITEDSNAGQITLDDEPKRKGKKAKPKADSLDVSDFENIVTTPDKSDDLEALKKDITPEDIKPEVVKKPKAVEPKTQAPEIKVAAPEVFDVGREERDLLGLAQSIQGQITNSEWNEVATAKKVDSYTVVRDDWLFKISKRIFGSGYYYPKIWSINSFITNPHFIEPGMVLSFTTGSGSSAPEFKIGSFSEDEVNAAPGAVTNNNPEDLNNFGEDAKPLWVDEKENLAKQGIYFQYASEETMDDLTKVSEQALNREYENYDPPANEFDVVLPKNYDRDGFDKSSKIFYSFKEGFYLSTFVSTNIVQDFGAIVNGPDENIYFTKSDRAYAQFDETMNVVAGDRFSVYSSGGKVKHPNSDRAGYKYTIVGQIKLLRKIQEKWEVEFIEVAGTPQRGDRITAFTPKINRITRTYNSKLIEAAILSTFQPMQTILGVGDVVYLDRGRADGLEMGNVLEVFGFKDRSTQKNITNQPTYKQGELTVITLTDNFATALVSNSTRDFYPGDIAISKTKEAHLRERASKNSRNKGEGSKIGGDALKDLDVDLNLENLNDDLLKQADKIQLTEEELAELDRQEREKSVIKDSEKDVKALERLENEIEGAETILNDAKLDEDKLLEDEDLNNIEKTQDAGESLDDIEENLGKRYVDEDLNSKENPYGLTEFDVEEVDELLNIEKDAEKK
ncbi:MAG TPA: LysM peptidoglycan-binding domain-containing protein [Bacteriovoracaceae bacterium]|nr:LysM peptidoglycan-binding domain-containing protein [Bacteriovoracaceae bacterium]